MSARTCASVRGAAILQQRAPGLANARSPRLSAPAAIETVRLPRHSGNSPEFEDFTGWKTGRFVHAFRFIFEVDLLGTTGTAKRGTDVL